MEDDASDRPTRRRVALTHRRAAVAGTILVFAGLLVALREVDLRTVAVEVSGADPALLAAAVGVYVASWPLRGRRYGDVLAAIGHPAGTSFLTLVVLLGQTANLALPARAGDGVRAYAMRARRDVPYPAGIASLAVERGFDLAAVATLTGAATAWLALAGGAGPLDAAGGVAGARTALTAAGGVAATTLTLGTATVVVARSDGRSGARLRAVAARFPRFRGPIEAALGFTRAVAVVARNPRAMLAVGAGSLLVWALDALTAVLVLAALDSGLAAGPLLAVGALAVSVGNLAKVLPLSQGGVGLYEAAFTALVVGLAPVGASTALAAAVVDHALKNAVTLVGGAGAVASLGVSPSTAEREVETETGTFLGAPKK